MSDPATESSHLMYVGTYTRETSAGIYAYRFDARSGQAEPLGLAAEIRNPSFLAVHPSGKLLYAVSETGDFDSEGSGSVAAFSVNERTGRLRKLNEVSSRGGAPCHLSVDSGGRMLIVANYTGGNVASLPIYEDGTLGEAASFFQHKGSSVHERQQRPHAHSADFSPDGQLAFFSDLGLDQVLVYRSDPAGATMAPHDPAFVEVAPGSGPRHLALHPAGRFAYGVNELSSTVTAYRLDVAEGFLEVIQTVPTLPEGFKGENYPAEILVHPSGLYVYASNRGHHSIAAFKVDEATGHLEPRGHAGTLGEWPRHFALDPTGRFLLAANERSDSIAVFRIDMETGGLTATEVNLAVDTPVCIVFPTAARSALN